MAFLKSNKITILNMVITFIAAFSLLYSVPVNAERNLPKPSGITGYAEMRTRLEHLQKIDATSGYHRMEVMTLGKSVKGRDIVVVRFHDPSNSDPGRSILYICRQHGHEPASTEGAMLFIKDLVYDAPDSDIGKCLQNTTVYIIPMANPDGAERYLRHNANNVDINRDWLTRRQPETRALWNAIQQIRPYIITDQHELYPTDKQKDYLETAGELSGLPLSLTQTCQSTADVVHLSMLGDGYLTEESLMRSGHNTRLAHRFGCFVAGVPTILFETNRSDKYRTIGMRAKAHLLFMETLLKDSGGERDLLISRANEALGIHPASALNNQARTNGPITNEPSTEENEGK